MKYLINLIENNKEYFSQEINNAFNKFAILKEACVKTQTISNVELKTYVYSKQRYIWNR